MRYSFYCKYCGDTHFSDSKEEIKEYKQNHRRTIRNLNLVFEGSKVCNYNVTDRETLARPELAEMINEEIRKQELEEMDR